MQRGWRWKVAMGMGLLTAGTVGVAGAQPLWVERLLQMIGVGTVLVERSDGEQVVAFAANEPFIPASILKLATSYCALTVLPKRFRFATAFHTTKDGTLYVTGFGDPALTSEELAVIAKQLRSHGLSTVRQIVLDDSFFDPGIHIDGQSLSLNPYDAHNSALLVNYNTVNVRKLKNGTVVSGEPQTPMTELTAQLARRLRPGAHRINLSRDPAQALLYVGHLLKAFLIEAGASVSGPVVRGHRPPHAASLYFHYSGKSLEENLRDLLEFSNNLVTNQLFLVMGAVVLGEPATVEKGQAVLRTCLRKHLGWQHVQLVEGSGLSRQNRVTAAEMMRLLKAFEPYAHLLPLKEEFFRAKTGSLNGVSSLAGYFTVPQGDRYRFVLISNDPKTTYATKFTAAKLIYRALAGLL